MLRVQARRKQADMAVPEISPHAPDREQTSAAAAHAALGRRAVRVRGTTVWLLVVVCTTVAVACLAHHARQARADWAVDAAHSGQGHPRRAETIERRGHFLQLSDGDDRWAQSLRDGSFFKASRSETRASSRQSRAARTRETSREERSSQRQHRHANPEINESRRSRGFAYNSVEHETRGSHDATYRTLCVRLCDGFYWPISFSTTRSRFRRDSKICEQGCDTPSALYYYDSDSGEPAEMVDLNGQPYTELSTAFLYRSKYDASCKCRPHPWEIQAADAPQRATMAQPPTATAPQASIPQGVPPQEASAGETVPDGNVDRQGLP